MSAVTPLDDVEQQALDPGPVVERGHVVVKQLNAFLQTRRFFSYATYVVSLRLRFAYFVALVLALCFVSMLAFVFAIFFSVLLPEHRSDEDWDLRAGLLLPVAPIVLVCGSWFIDKLIDLVRDALSPAFLPRFRQKLAVVLHVLTAPAAAVTLSTNNVRVVDFMTTVVLEVVPFIGFVLAARDAQRFLDALNGYYAYGLATASGLGIVFVVVDFLTLQVGRFADALRHADAHTPQLVTAWTISETISEPMAAANLGRNLVDEQTWVGVESNATNKSKPLYERLFAQYTKHVPFLVRVVLDVVMFWAFALLTAYGLLPFGLGWSACCLMLLLLGLKFREQWEVLSSAFTGVLLFFALFSMLLFLFSVTNQQPQSRLEVAAPTQASSTNLTSPVSTHYPICRPVWNQLHVLDLAMLSSVVYASSAADFETRMDRAFGNTSLGAWTLVYEAPAADVIHFKHVRFAGPATDVVLVRGTSTSYEVYEDALLYAPITTFQLIDSILPLQSLLPDTITQSLMRALALPALTAAPKWDHLLTYVSTLPQSHTVVTGHSLGGALAGLAGAINSVPAVVFSPPGLYYNQKRLNVNEDALRRFVYAIVPDRDLVPRVDRLVGQVNMIRCPRGSAASCHSIDRTLCTLAEDCIDPRMRTGWGAYCGAL